MASNTSGTRRSYSASFKLKVISLAEEKGKHFAARSFNVHRRRVQEWCQDKARLEAVPKGEKRKSGAGRPLKYPDIEASLLKWFDERREGGVRVTGKSLRHEALRLHRENGNQSFKASNGWYQRFKKRHIVFRRTTHISQHPVHITDNRIDKFLIFVTRMRKFREYSDSEILNMDETPVWFEMPGKSSLSYAGETEVRVASTGHEKEKITVTLAAYGDGTKLAPLVHLPGVRPPKKDEIPAGIQIIMCGSGNKSWANEDSIIFWLKQLYGVNNQRRRLLVWDAFRAHITQRVKDLVKVKHNSDMAVIPGGCTCKLQPADVSWNRPFKAKLAELYDEWIFNGPIERTRAGNRKAPPKALLLKWIKDAWAAITPDVIRKSFKKCGITVALDGTEDHLFQQDSDSDDDDQSFEGFSDDDVAIAEQASFFSVIFMKTIFNITWLFVLLSYKHKCPRSHRQLQSMMRGHQPGHEFNVL